MVAFGATLRSLVRLPFVAFFRRVFSEFSETRTRRRRLAVARVLGAREQKNARKVPEHQRGLNSGAAGARWIILRGCGVWSSGGVLGQGQRVFYCLMEKGNDRLMVHVGPWVLE